MKTNERVISQIISEQECPMQLYYELENDCLTNIKNQLNRIGRAVSGKECDYFPTLNIGWGNESIVSIKLNQNDNIEIKFEDELVEYDDNIFKLRVSLHDSLLILAQLPNIN